MCITRTKEALLTVLIGSALLVAPAGCSDDEVGKDELSCPSDPGPFTIESARVTGTVDFTPPTEPLTRGDVLVINGTANHEDGLAIREVVVAGVSATLGEFNFKRWSAEVSYDNFVVASAANDQGQVTASAYAVDACGNRYPFLEFTVAVDQTPNLNVDELSIAVAYPAGRSYVPSDGTAAVVLTVTGTGRATGANIQLMAASGSFQGTAADDSVILASNQDGTSASATALYYADTPGTTIITALVEDEVATAMVVATGPPVIAPAGASLVPGAELEAVIFTDGALDNCRATLNEHFEVSHGGIPLAGAPVPATPDDNGEYLIRVKALSTAPETTSLTLTCFDEFGQFDNATFDLVVSDPPSDVVVDTLALDVQLPDGRDYLPADGSAPAVVTITGTGMAGNADVAISASSGRFQGDADGVVVLGGSDTASAVVLFYADTAGTVVLTARSGDVTTTTTLNVAGSPQLAPGGGTLVEGMSLKIAILTEGVIASCQVTPDASFAVTHGGSTVGAAPTPIDADPQGNFSVNVGVVFGAVDAATIDLTCSDEYGQFATATFTAAVF